MSWLLVLPVALPFATAIAAFLLRERPAGRWISILGSAGLLVVSGLLMAQVLEADVVAAQMGGWAAPFGITLVADRLSAAMVLITGIVALAISVYALADIEARLERLGYHALFQVLIAGVNGAFVTGDLFNLYVWVRGDADRLLRPAGAGRLARADRRRRQIRGPEPDRHDPCS